MGGTASLMQLEKIRLIKAINPNVEIGWDGGVMADNAYSLVQGGVDVLNVGSAIQKAGDPQAAFAKLQQEIAKTGVI
jgi:ribulose-phosphate 3-epimerase